MTIVKKSKQEINLVTLIERYHNEDKCRAYLEEQRWPDGVACPRCGSMSVSSVKKRGQYDCNDCRYQFSVTSGTILHDTHLDLWKWVATAYMMIESKKGISANQVSRTIGVSYKTAWFLCHRIRFAMSSARFEKLRGIVEADETYVGGKRRHVGRGYRANKTVVAGAVERGGNTVLEVVPGQDRQTLTTFLDGAVHDDAEAIYTDEFSGYDLIGDENTRHKVVVHSKEEWVRGDVHTNTVEGIWSLLKRSIVGSYHQISPKHLDAYLDELEWRFNNRNNPYLFRDTVKRLIQSENLEYKKLIN